MAYDEVLASRIRDALRGRDDVREQRMFGGIAFMVRGNMACGVVGNELMARVGPDGHDEALAEPHVRPMDFSGRPMRGFIYVGQEGVAGDEALRRWVAKTVAFAETLPPK